MHPRLALLPSLLCLALWTTQAAGDPPRTDRYGDPLPDGAVFRIGTTRLRHEIRSIPPFTNVRTSPDGKFVFSSGSGGGVRMWETATGREVRRFMGASRFMDFSGRFSLSPDGSLLVVGDGDRIQLYDTATGKKHRTLDLSGLQIVGGYVDFPPNSFSPDGKILTAFYAQGQPPQNNHILRWEIASGKVLGTWQTGTNQPLALSRDGRLAASLGDENQTIRLWETTSGKKVQEWKTGREVPSGTGCLIFSPDDRHIVTAGKDAMIRVYETATGKEMRSWQGWTPNRGAGKPNHVAVGWLTFAPDGKTLASVDRNLVLRFWDWKTGRELRHFEGVYGPVAFSRDGKMIVAGGADSRVRLWDTASGRDLCPFVDPGGITEVAFSPIGNVLAANSDRGDLRLLDAGGRELKAFPGYDLLAFSPDGRSLLTTRRNSHRFFVGPLYLLDAATGKERCRFQDANENYDPVGLSSQGKILLTQDARDCSMVFAWDTASGKKIWELRGKKGVVYVGCSPDSRTAAIAYNSDTNIHLIAADTAKELRQLTIFSGQVNYGANRGNTGIGIGGFLYPHLSPNGKVLLAGCDQNAFGLWDLDSGKRIVRLNCAEVLPAHPAFSPDGKWLALPDAHGDPCLVDTATGRVRHRLMRKGGELGFLLQDNRVFSPDGRLLAVAYDPHTLVLWEVATGRPICTWPGHGRGKLCQMVFSPDGRRLATVGTDGTALVWDVMGQSPDGQLPARKLTAEETKQAWNDLAEADAAKAHRAVWSLVADPAGALPLLREHLRPSKGIDTRRLAQLIADLDSDDFTSRETATRELRKVGELAEPALRAALKGKPSPEQRRRVQGLLEEIDSAVPSAESLRNLRAVAVLEHIASTEARQLLGVLAEGAAGASLTREAKESLVRFRSRRVQP